MGNNVGTWNDDMNLWKLSRLIGLGLALLGLMAFHDAASARPPKPKMCYTVLEEHPEIPEAEYLDVAKDVTHIHDLRLRECAGEWYAMQHPESVGEFIKLLDRDRNTAQFATMILGRLGPPARPAIPLLLDSGNLISYYKNSDSPLIETLRDIGIVERESIDKLLDMVTKRPDPLKANRENDDTILGDMAVRILSRQKTLPAYVGDAVIAELDRNGDADREFSKSLYQILIPVRTPRAVVRYVEMTKKGLLSLILLISDRSLDVTDMSLKRSAQRQFQR
jgi:hypothetical protein